MAQSLLTAAAGLKAQQQNIDSIAHNIANINTDGFKRGRVNFQEAVYTAMQNPALPPEGQTGNLQRGSGAFAASETRILDVGPMTQTGVSLDLAITGDGYFTVDAICCENLYTRDGKFQSVSIDGQSYLATAGGNFVLDDQGMRIGSPDPLDKIEVDSSGRISLNGAFLTTLGLGSFDRPESLEAHGAQLWQATEASGPVKPSTASGISQGAVEGSNVDIATEMTRLMSAQRAYAFLGRAITTADAMSSVENDIRR
jgi:flagellar basal-body rod protein FlgG